jgi:NADH-quinone oxidoreductase subunit C
MNEDSYTLKRIQEEFTDSVLRVHTELGEETVVILKNRLTDLVRFLKEDPELDFNYLIDITAVDYWKRKPRFEVVYHFYSRKHGYRLRVKVPVGEPDPEVDTIHQLWPVANWLEREVWDMFGIRFKDHPDLRRILMYPEFEGHPLRKDYPIAKRQPLIGPKD